MHALVKGYYKILDTTPSVTIFVSCINTAFATELCIRSISKNTSYANYRVVIGDCGSVDSTLPRLMKMYKNGYIHEIQLQPMGRPHAEWLDYWTSTCETNYAVFLDSDIEILNPNWLHTLVEIAEKESCALVTAEILNLQETNYKDHTGVTRRLYPRPAPWLVMIRPEKCYQKGSWKFKIVKDSSIYEKEWAYDTGSEILKSLIESGEKVLSAPEAFQEYFRHYGGLSWVNQSKIVGWKSFLKYAKVSMLKFYIFLRVRFSSED